MRAPANTPTSGIHSPEDVPAPRLASGRPRTIALGVVVTSVGMLIFLVLHFLVTTHEVGVIRAAVERGTLDAASGDRFALATYLTNLVGGGLAYLMLAVGGVAVASRGHRLLFALPAIAYVFVPVLSDGLMQPEPVGNWAMHCFSCGSPWFADPWLGATVDVTLVLIPGWIVGKGAHPKHRLEEPDAAAVAVFVTTVALIVTAVWAIAVVQRFPEFRVITAVAALGLVLGVARPWWPWFQVLFAVAITGTIGLTLSIVLWSVPEHSFTEALPYALERLWPVVAVGLIASAWQPLAASFRRSQDRPFVLVVAVTLLNALDAILTLLAVRSGGAYESNPVIDLIGLPAKIALVGLLTWLLYRRKPAALIWPAAILLWVTGYHLAGIIVNGWR